MKKTIILSLALLLGGAAFAQKEKMVSAYEYLRHKELDKAKDRIDQATAHESSGQMAKAWKYRGEIYLAIANSKNETYKALHAEPLLEAALAFKKCIELDTKGKYKKDAVTQITNLKVTAFNNGIAALKAETPDHKSAYSVLMQATKMDPSNTYKDYGTAKGAIDNGKIKSLAASAAKDGGMNTEAIALYKEIADASNPDVKRRYLANFDIANIYVSANDFDNAVATLEGAAKAFPDSADVTYKLYDLYVKQDKVEEQLAKLEAAEPKTDAHYYLIGKSNYIFAAKPDIKADEQLVFMDKAIEAWKKTLEMNAKHRTANRDLGELLLAQGATAKAVADENWKNADLSAKKDAEASALFNEAIQRFEAQLTITPTSLFTLDKIKTCYSKLKQFDKVKEYDEKIKAAQAAN